MFGQFSKSILNSFGSSVVVLLCYQVIPIIVTTVIYTLIGLKLRRFSTVVGQSSVIDQKKRKQVIQTVKMLVAILTTYFLLSLPVSMVINIEFFRSGHRNTCKLESHKLLLIMSTLANIVNPFILCYYNSIFKQQTLQIFCCQARTVQIDSSKSVESQDTSA